MSVLGELQRRSSSTFRQEGGEALLKAAQLGEAVDAWLSSEPVALQEVARAIAHAADEVGAEALLGASPLGDRLSGAAVALAQKGLHLFAPGVKAKTVAVIDGISVSGVRLAHAVKAAGEAGATEISAVVLLAPYGKPSGLSDHLKAFIVLGNSTGLCEDQGS